MTFIDRRCDTGCLETTGGGSIRCTAGVVGMCNPKGWTKVAGGRSGAKTTGNKAVIEPPWRGATAFDLAPLQGAIILRPPSGGLRYASTTGYSLSAFQAA